MNRKPSEFAINSFATIMSVLQYDELDFISSLNLFNDRYPCHIYMICRRPRVSIEPEKFKSNEEFIDLSFKIHNKDKFDLLELTVTNPFAPDLVELVTEYPYNTFILKSNDRSIKTKTVSFLQNIPSYAIGGQFLDLEILYIGQSYGVDGARTAPERLKKHETLQAIYAEALNKNPDQEIWLFLLSFDQVGITMFDGRTKFTDEEFEKDEPRAKKFFNTIWNGGITEQQFINFTEAALIRYFQPPYNKEYKNTFPNPAHKTYIECYDLDVNSVCIEIGTSDAVNVMVYSETIERAPTHFGDFLLHNKNERKSMFDFFGIKE